MRDSPETTPKYDGTIRWNYLDIFRGSDSRDTRVIYVEGQGLFVYDGYWIEKGRPSSILL